MRKGLQQENNFRVIIFAANIAVFKAKQPAGEEQIKSCTEFCLPACNETFYNFVVTAATFPNQPEPNMTQMLREAITEKREHLNNISYVRCYYLSISFNHS